MPSPFPDGVPLPSRRRHLSALVVVALLAAGGQAAGQEETTDIRVSQHGRTFVIDATFEAPVPLAIAWEVLTDFEAMDAFVPNLAVSRVLARDGTRMTIAQRGVARFGPLQFRFDSERIVTLQPRVAIRSVQTRGSMERLESYTTFAPVSSGTRLGYHVEVVPGALYPDALMRRFLEHEVGEQFDAIVREMVRRRAERSR